MPDVKRRALNRFCQVTKDTILQLTGTFVGRFVFYPINWLIWSAIIVWTVRALTLGWRGFNIFTRPSRIHFCIDG